MELQDEIRRRMENRAPWFRFENGKFYIESIGEGLILYSNLHKKHQARE